MFGERLQAFVKEQHPARCRREDEEAEPAGGRLVELAGAGGVLGRQIRINGMPGTIVGVMPQGFEFPETEVWVPLRQDRSGDAWGIVYGRMVRARRAAMVILKVPCLCGQPLRNMCVGRARCVVRQNR